MEKGVPIRSISRCISVLRVINEHSPVSLMKISRDAEVPYATACRIVQTLICEGLIEKEPSRLRYRPTAAIQGLSQGFQNHDRLVAAARSHIVDLTKTLLWPVSVTTRVGQYMVVRDSTHTLTSMTFNNYHPGYQLPIMGSAAGRAYLAYCTDEERQRLLEGLRGTPQYRDDDMVSLIESNFLIEEIRRQKYATKVKNSYIENPGKTSSISVPLMDGDTVCGALIMSYFTSAMRMSEAETRLAPALIRAAESIQMSLLSNVECEEGRLHA
jgi:IclR family mhp operon transcriptional activator